VPSTQVKERCRELGISDAPITLRLIRIGIDLDEAEEKREKEQYEILITSILDRQRYPAEEFDHLYHLRWGVEEGYKQLKLRSELESWSAGVQLNPSIRMSMPKKNR